MNIPQNFIFLKTIDNFLTPNYESFLEMNFYIFRKDSQDKYRIRTEKYAKLVLFFFFCYTSRFYLNEFSSRFCSHVRWTSILIKQSSKENDIAEIHEKSKYEIFLCSITFKMTTSLVITVSRNSYNATHHYLNYL